MLNSRGSNIEPCRTPVVILSHSLVVRIFPRSLGVICYDRWVLTEGNENYFKDLCYMNLQSTFLFLAQKQWIMSILWKSCKADNFQSHNSLKVNITNIWSLHSNFVHSESLLEWNSPDTIALCETNQDHSMGERLSSFNPKGFLYSYTWYHSLCEGRTSLWTRLISRKLSRILFMFSNGFTLLSV